MIGILKEDVKAIVGWPEAWHSLSAEEVRELIHLAETHEYK